MQYAKGFLFYVAIQPLCTELAFLANVMMCNTVLSRTSSYPQLIPSLTCNRLALGPIPEVSVSRYKGFTGS